MALPGADAWTLEELVESFEADRLGKAWRGDEDGGREGEGGGGGGGGGGLRPKAARNGAAAEGVSLMKERVRQLRKAIAEEKLKPLGNRLFQVRVWGRDGVLPAVAVWATYDLA